MKKLLFKRIIALIVDCFVCASILSLISLFLNYPSWFFVFEFSVYAIPISLPSIGFYLVLLAIIFKDCLFRNASIGKKIVGLVIYDKNWSIPKINVLLKRTIVMSTIGFVMFWRFKFEGNLISFFTWERNVLKTQVVDKKTYKKIKNDAYTMDGIFEKNMSELYNLYLLDSE